jgi:hypothetical protein
MAISAVNVAAAAAGTFVRLYFLPTKPNVLPDSIRTVPAW